MAVFFDISKAFDRVWHDKLLEKLDEIKVSGHLYKFIQQEEVVRMRVTKDVFTLELLRSSSFFQLLDYFRPQKRVPSARSSNL